ncbi:MAG: hypothetical protein IJH63_00280 [Methanobrevibacter sp.]|nr:hypothetical protein [Methanobrevibacter sp.]
MICYHEEQIQNQSRKIAELEARADYKDKRIDEIILNSKRMEDKIDGLSKAVNTLTVKLVEDDATLKHHTGELSERVTALETRQDTTYKLIGLVSVFLLGMEFILKYVIR